MTLLINASSSKLAMLHKYYSDLVKGRSQTKWSDDPAAGSTMTTRGGHIRGTVGGTWRPTFSCVKTRGEDQLSDGRKMFWLTLKYTLYRFIRKFHFNSVLTFKLALSNSSTLGLNYRSTVT